jgi:hypothetical protein
MRERFCPLKRMDIELNIRLQTTENDDPSYFVCAKEYCQWWTSAYTTEGIEIWNCALVIGAIKNSDGKIPV